MGVKPRNRPSQKGDSCEFQIRRRLRFKKIVRVGNQARLLFHHYVALKAGVLAFARALAREVGGDNICVNSIIPGMTISSANQEGVTSPEQLADRRKRRAIQRDQYPADLVGTVIFLASDNSNFMTGQSIVVDGGMNMH
ncbi:MAG TPA: SDR family oxidoreductase [Candidatus Limnocylindrales bacterium]|nr:SDR family oxidoreductase [Candidatus Limnocylindrales bacterium]